MALAYAPDVRLLCCGGAGLNVLEIISRPTKDVDILAQVGEGHALLPARAFSPEMEVAVAKTAIHFGLASDWINSASSILLQRGLPPGLVERSAANARQYGPCLRIQFIARIDQVALKLNAAMDPLEGRRHADDLVAMSPTEEELNHGLAWLLSWQSSDAFKIRLSYIVEGLGFSMPAACEPQNAVENDPDVPQMR
jgi:hypothetical protein